MRGHDQDDKALTEQAAEWVVRLGDAEENEECRAASEAWRRQSPRHEAVFADVAAWSLRLYLLDPRRQVDVRALLTDSQKIIPLFPPAPVRSRRSRLSRWVRRYRKSLARVGRIAAMTAGIVFVTLGLFAAKQINATAVEYRTEIGERRVVRLEDGTFVHLNTRSQIEVHFNRDQRTVRLLAGEALLEVAPDAKRQFQVVTGNVTIKDIGTTFSIRRNPDGVDVLVAEGSVQVTVRDYLEASRRHLPSMATNLVAGQAATISYRPGTPALIRALAAEEISHKLAWKDGKLFFAGESLAVVVTEINRYNTRALTLADPAIGTVRMGGMFAPTDLETFVRSLKAVGVTADQPISNSSSTEPIRLVRGE